MVAIQGWTMGLYCDIATVATIILNNLTIAVIHMIRRRTVVLVPTTGGNEPGEDQSAMRTSEFRKALKKTKAQRNFANSYLIVNEQFHVSILQLLHGIQRCNEGVFGVLGFRLKHVIGLDDDQSWPHLVHKMRSEKIRYF